MHWHPMVVHFPLALVSTAAACLTAARMLPACRHPDAAAIAGTWNLCLGAVALVAALGSGLGAALHLDLDAAARLALAAHVKSAVLATLLILLTALWRGVGLPQTARPTWGFLLVLYTAVAVLLVTGYRGGENVYHHGMGVERGMGAERSAVQSR